MVFKSLLNQNNYCGTNFSKEKKKKNNWSWDLKDRSGNTLMKRLREIKSRNWGRVGEMGRVGRKMVNKITK